MHIRKAGGLPVIALAMAVSACGSGAAHPAGPVPGLAAARRCPALAPEPAAPEPAAQGPPKRPGVRPLVRAGPAFAVICQYEADVRVGTSRGLSDEITMTGAAADGLAAVIDSGTPVSARAERCADTTRGAPPAQLIRFGYPAGTVTPVVVQYQACFLAIASAGPRRAQLGSPVVQDLGFYSELTLRSRGPRTPDLIGLRPSAAQALARRTGFILGVDGAVLDTRVPFGHIIFQVLPPGSRSHFTAGRSVGVILAVRPAPACAPAQLRARYVNGGAGTGHDFGSLIFRDTGAAPCRLAGPLRVVGLSAAGRPVTSTVTGVVSGPSILSPRAAPIPDGAPPPAGELAEALVLIAEYRDDPAGPGGLCTPFWVIPATWRIVLPGGPALTAPNSDHASGGLTSSGSFVTCRGRLGVFDPVTSQSATAGPVGYLGYF